MAIGNDASSFVGIQATPKIISPILNMFQKITKSLIFPNAVIIPSKFVVITPLSITPTSSPPPAPPSSAPHRAFRIPPASAAGPGPRQRAQGHCAPQ